MGGSGTLVLERHQDFVTTFDDLVTRMQFMFQDMINKTIGIIESCNRSLQDEITALRRNIQQLQEECRAEIVTLSNNMKKIENEMCSIAERTAAMERNNDLLLFGIPFHPSECLSGFLQSVCSELGYGSKDTPLVFTKRLARAPIKTGTTPPILLQFAFKHDRCDFFRRYLSSRRLSLHHLGFSSQSRIYLSENLTRQARVIKRAALKLKRDSKLHSVFTKDGIVFTKITADAAAVPILSLEQLPS